MSQVSIKQLIEEGKADEEDANLLRAKGTSLVACDICGQLLETKNVRSKIDLCDKHKKLKGSVGKYQNYMKSNLTEGEKQNIINSKTTRIGPFKYGS